MNGKNAVKIEWQEGSAKRVLWVNPAHVACVIDAGIDHAMIYLAGVYWPITINRTAAEAAAMLGWEG